MAWYDYVLRGFSIAIALLVIAHFMGKRIVTQMSTVDFVVGITVGSIAAIATLDPEVPLWAGLLALATWAGFQWAYVKLEQHSPAFRSVLAETETILVQNGEILPSGLDKGNISQQILMSELRAQKITDLADVEMATLEPTGKIAVKVFQSQNATKVEKQSLFPKPKK